jgi:hypothetical protein
MLLTYYGTQEILLLKTVEVKYSHNITIEAHGGEEV